MPEFAYTARQVGSAAVTNAVKALSHADFGFSAAQIAAAREAIVCSLATDGAGSALGGVNLLDTGGDPSVTLGVHLPAGSSVAVRGSVNIGNLRFIRSDTTDARVTVILGS